jgi:signal peptidase I
MSVEQHTLQESVIASLYMKALRQGRSLWFRVVSGSMQPTLHVGDSVFIHSTQENDIQPGDIAAFETNDGLVIHRIVRRRQNETHTQLLEMSDVELAARWIDDQAIVGRVIFIRHSSHQVDLQRPMAKKCGIVTAYLRYALLLLYNAQKLRILRVILHKVSRLPVHFCYQLISRSSASQWLNNEEGLYAAEE